MLPEQSDVLIIGAGPAGLAAALELKRLGVRDVVVVDREAEAGGTPRLCHHTGFGLHDWRRVYSGPAYAARYRQAALAAGVILATSTTITGWKSETTVTYTSPQGIGQTSGQALLLATGCRERPRAARLVPGSRPAGIFTTGSLQRFVYANHLPVGKKAVIVGAELVSLSALLTLRHAGVHPALMVTELPNHQLYWPYLPMKWLFADLLTHTPVVTRTKIGEIYGQPRVEGVTLIELGSGRSQQVDCDTVIFSGDWIPEHELARLGGLDIDPGTRGPQIDSQWRTSRFGVFAAGNLLRGAETADTSALEGRQAAQQIARFLRQPDWPQQPIPVEVSAPLAWVCPNRITTTTQLGQAFGFQTQQFCNHVQVEVWQGERRLHTQSFRHLRPMQTHSLTGNWVDKVDLHGSPLRLRIVEG